MKKIKVISIFGTRPEAIKMAPLVKELESREEIDSIVAVTAQHREMLDQVLSLFDITPDHDLSIMTQNQTLAGITSKALAGLNDIIAEEQPDLVLVHGDTTTTMAASLATFYNQVKLGHVEAGLRTHNKYSPFPEEVNREIAGIIADFHFSPTKTTEANLLNEGKKQEDIFVVGNTAIDALKYTVNENYTDENLDWVSDSRFILLTAHRRENIGENMENIFSAIKKIVTIHEDVKVIYPIHMNPKVREIAAKYFADSDQVRLIEPLDVSKFHNYMKKAYFVLTDSGGIQEEAPGLKKPVLVLRDTTERPEGVEAGTLKLAGVNADDIFRLADELLTDKKIYNQMQDSINPYGDGTTSKQIVDIIIEKLK